MGQSLVKNYVHIIFSTKHCENYLNDDIQPELFSYFGGICNNLECYPVKIGGHTDHIHILCLLSKKIALVKFLQELKTNSSKWIKTKHPIFSNFHWQDGYDAFSVNPTQTDAVTKYIKDQSEHHKTVTFQDEYRAFLKKYNIEYDERYVWD